MDELVSRHLERFDVYSRTSRLDGTSTFERLSRELRRFLLDRSADARFTTMFDYYKLPRHFPGFSDELPLDPLERVTHLERSFEAAIGDRRFVPYIQLHEFEALLFTDILQLANYYSEHLSAIRDLEAERRQFRSPEHIDDNEQTAPSKRILKKIAGYDKPTAGALTAIDIGLERLRAACAHFNAWIERLERLGSETTS